MNLKNAKILLTISLEGGYKPWFVEVSDKEGLKDTRSLYNPEFRPCCECHRVIHLSPEFVNNAISFEGRVSARMTFAYNNWKKMTPMMRLECCIGELALALGGSSFTYEVIPEEENS